MENVNDSYFDGHYKDIWRLFTPPLLTEKEVAFMVNSFNLSTQNTVLDLMCGFGRHAIAFAKQGMQVTAIDNLEEYVNEIKEIAQRDNLPINATKQSVLSFKSIDSYDLVICMGNSLNFFARNNVDTIFKMVAKSLKPGGYFLINSESLAETIFAQPTANTWHDANGIKYLASMQMCFHPTRIEIDTFMISDDGSVEEKKAIDYIFSINELDEMLRDAGLQISEIWSIPGRKKFVVGDERAYIIIQKQ